MPHDISNQLTTYLTDAHSIEEQALRQLRTAPDVAGEPGLAAALYTHLAETERHEERIRGLLEARGAKPSAVKDTVMRAGGAGFVLFARAQADTPGKLAAHALWYEALEWASYDLLARTADRAGEASVAEVARSIRDEERTMMDRIEDLWDATADASLRDTGTVDLERQLVTYLADAHAIEVQSIQLLEAGRGMVALPELQRAFESHLTESREQQQVLETRLEAHGSSRSILKDVAMRIGALNWGMFFLAQPDTDGKLAAFAYAFEHLEIGGYQQLARVAERAGDPETAAAAIEIAGRERRAAEAIAETFDGAVNASLSVQSRRG